jgi:hypothetical protein
MKTHLSRFAVHDMQQTVPVGAIKSVGKGESPASQVRPPSNGFSQSLRRLSRRTELDVQFLFLSRVLSSFLFFFAIRHRPFFPFIHFLNMYHGMG